MSLFLSMSEFVLELSLENAQLQAWIQEDFHFLVCKKSDHQKYRKFVRIEQKNQNPNLDSLGPALFQTRLCRVHGWGFRTNIYSQHALTMDAGWPKQITLYGEHFETLYEILYYLLISLLGEDQDLMGRHRLHAFAFELDQKAYALCLPSQGGKSFLAFRAMTDPDLKIYSDEIPLFNGKRIYPFPIRLSVRESALSEFKEIVASGASSRLFLKNKLGKRFLIPMDSGKVAQVQELDAILIGRKSKAYSFSKSGFLEKLKWSFDFVLGLGVPQMAEFMIRRDNFRNLFVIFLKRMRVVIHVLSSKKFYTLQFSHQDPRTLSSLKDSLRKGL